MLRRSNHPITLSKQSSYNKAVRQAHVDFSLKHSSDIPAAQAKPTFAVPKSPHGTFKGIDTSFCDIPEVGQNMPVPEDVILSLREIAQQRREQQVKLIMKEKMKNKVMLLESSKNATKSNMKKKGDAQQEDLLLTASSSSSAITSIAPLSESQQQEDQLIQQEINRLMAQLQETEKEKFDSTVQAAKSHFEQRSALARSIVTMAEKLHLNKTPAEKMRSVSYEIKNLNSGPSYEMRTIELQRRRSWFSLRHSFLTSAPILFGYSQTLDELMTVLEAREQEQEQENSNNNDNNKDFIEIASLAAESMATACQSLTWMKFSADKNFAWTAPIEWDRRTPSDFEQIDYATLASHLLEQFANVLEFAVRISSKKDSSSSSSSPRLLHEIVPALSLDTLISLLNLCDEYNVDRSTVGKAINGETIHILLDQCLESSSSSDLDKKKGAPTNATEKMSKRMKPITPMSAIGLGLVCDESLLEISSSQEENDNSSSSSTRPPLALRLLDTILNRGSLDSSPIPLGTFSAPDLNFLMEFLMRIKKANPHLSHVLSGKPEELTLARPISARPQSSKMDSNNDEENDNQKVSAAALERETLRLFNSTLIAAQRRMRVHMNTNISDPTIEHIHSGEIMEDDPLNPLKKLMDYQMKNNSTFTVLESHKIYHRLIEGLKSPHANPKQIVRFFKLLMDISAEQQKQQNNNNNIKNSNSRSRSDVSSSSSSATLVCTAWMQDVLHRASTHGHGAANSFVSTGECISLLETIAAAANHLYTSAESVAANISTSTLLIRTMTLIERSIKDNALSLRANELVSIFKSFTILQPVMLNFLRLRAGHLPENVNLIQGGEGDPVSFPTCLDALEMRLLRSDFSTLLRKSISRLRGDEKLDTDANTYHRKYKREHQQEYRLSLNQQTEIANCLIQLNSMNLSYNGGGDGNNNNSNNTSPRLAARMFTENSVRALQRLEFVIKSQNKAPSNYRLIGDCLKNGAQIALSLVSLPHHQQQLNSSSSSSSTPNTEIQLAVLLDSMMKLIVTPISSSKSIKKKNARIDISRISLEEATFIFTSLLQVLGSTSSANSRNLPIIAPCHKICEEILARRVDFGEKQQEAALLSACSTFLAPHLFCNDQPAILVAARGLSKVVSKSSFGMNQKGENGSTAIISQKMVSNTIFSLLADCSALQGRFNFLELVDSFCLLQKHEDLSLDTTAMSKLSSSITNSLDQFSGILKSVIDSQRQKNEVDREQNDDDEESYQFNLQLLRNVDLLPMLHASEKIVSVNTPSTSTNDHLIKNMKESALRFAVSAFAYEQKEAKNKVRDHHQNPSKMKVNFDTSKLGFERTHLANSAAEKAQSDEMKEMGLVVRKCLNQVKDDLELNRIAQDEWKSLMAATAATSTKKEEATAKN